MLQIVAFCGTNLSNLPFLALPLLFGTRRALWAGPCGAACVPHGNGTPWNVDRKYYQYTFLEHQPAGTSVEPNSLV